MAAGFDGNRRPLRNMLRPLINANVAPFVENRLARQEFVINQCHGTLAGKSETGRTFAVTAGKGYITGV